VHVGRAGTTPRLTWQARDASDRLDSDSVAHPPSKGARERQPDPTLARARETALQVVSPKVDGAALVRGGLVDLCEDARFSLNPITPDGLLRADAVLSFLREVGDPRLLDTVLQRSLLWFQQEARPPGLNPIEEVEKLRIISRLGEASLLAVEQCVGALALVRTLSEDPTLRSLSLRGITASFVPKSDDPP
jgi:hypothetical protein